MENWNVTPEEKKIFENQFLTLNPLDGNISGENAKEFFVQSGLHAKILAFIWELSDVTRDGQLNLHEFIIACKLIQMKLRGSNIPPTLPPPLIAFLNSKNIVLSTVTSPIANFVPVTEILASSVVSGTTSGVASAAVSVTNTAPGTPLETPTAGSPSSNYEWSIPYNTKLKYTQAFNQADKDRTGFLTGNQARSIMVLTQLSIEVLAKIWNLADIDGDGQLSCEEFVLAMYLCDQVKAGKELKSPLPPELLPPSFVKKSRQNSLQSISSIDNGMLSITAPQTAFEDKRKENFEKGQAELERRRQALLEIQRQEKEERERKEREEEERKDKIRLEQEKRRQEEMEKQLQKQREIEREKTLERQKVLEQRENARKEMEKQRYYEWKKQRIQDLEMHHKKEFEYVTSLQEKNNKLNNEYEELCNQIRDLSQQIGKTRNGVNAVKSAIDNMRLNRDSLLTDMTSLKTQLKDQNQRLIALNKEKVILEAKKNAAGFIDNNAQEQMKFDIMNQQIIVNRIQEEVNEIKKELENKKTDYNNNITELTELKTNTENAIEICSDLYSQYSERKQKVIKLKAEKLNDVSAWGDSAWNTTPDTWSEREAAIGTKKYRALYEFIARNNDEISFQPGDIIIVNSSQSSEPGWLAGELKGKSGWFPESYVECIENEFISDNINVDTNFQNGIDPSLEDIVEVPENVSDAGSAIEDVGPAINDITPSLNAGVFINSSIKALYSWKARDNNQLSFNKGDVIPVIRKHENWYYGEKQDYSGWIPAPYVTEIATMNSNGIEEYYVALYPYTSTEPDDLCFEQNDTIKVIKKDGDWWTGILNGKTGVFPSNYVQEANYQPPFSPTMDYSASQIPRCASAPPTQLENQQAIPVNRAMTPDFSTLASNEISKSKKPEIATVIAPYQATSKEQLSLHRGQLIMIRKKTTSGWWEGETYVKGKKRQIGWFPASYVKIVGAGISGMTSPINMGSRKQSVQSVQSDSGSPLYDRVMALYKYSALNPDELSFEKDDVIKMISKEEPDWWKGELKGSVGLFPSNYVKPLCK